MFYATDQRSTQVHKVSQQEVLAQHASAVILGFALEVTSVYKYLKEGAKRMEPGCFHWFTEAKPEAMGTHWNTWGFPLNIGKHFLLGGWPSTGTGFPEELWSLHPWSTRHQSCMAGCRWPCLRRDIGPNNLQRCLPALAILLFSNCIKQIEFDVQLWEFKN